MASKSKSPLPRGFFVLSWQANYQQNDEDNALAPNADLVFLLLTGASDLKKMISSFL